MVKKRGGGWGITFHEGTVHIFKKMFTVKRKITFEQLLGTLKTGFNGHFSQDPHLQPRVFQLNFYLIKLRT